MSRDRGDGRRQRYEQQSRDSLASVPAPIIPTQAELREYLGDELFQRLGLGGYDADLCDAAWLQARYFCEGGLLLFLEEGFPNSTSLKPFGRGQRRAVGVVESVILNGGVEQSLEPRAFGKSSRACRAALWAGLGKFRKCGVCFQSSAEKSVQQLNKIQNELSGSPFVRALVPAIAQACRHAKINPQRQRVQHFEGDLTNIQWLKDRLRLPDIQGEPGAGYRLICMPFSKAAGLALSDPVTLEDIRPDLLLPDDVQAHDNATSANNTEKLLRIWRGSVKYLCGRGKAGATVFTQTIFAPDDMAEKLSDDPAVHTVRYQFLEKFPTNLEWWETTYRDVLLDYDQLDENGQHKARLAARALYLANQKMADAGAEVSWEHAFDPEYAASAIQQAMNNFLEDPEAFWAQDQNDPRKAISTDEDLRATPSEILAKVHPEKRERVPDWAHHLVAHIDVHDSLLYYGVAAGSDTMRMGLVDRQTWPKQKANYFTLRTARSNFKTLKRYSELPTTQDKIRVALQELVEQLLATDYRTEDGTRLEFAKIGIDCSDGDHWDTVHAFCRESKIANLIPMRGIAPKASQLPINARPKKPDERGRGDHWIARLSKRTQCKWLEFDASYYKAKLHKGFKAPLSTSESISLYKAGERSHLMLADHCNAEIPEWQTSQRANEVASGVWAWVLKPGADNHMFDNLVGCMALLNHVGGKFLQVAAKKQRRRVKASEAQKRRRKRK